MLNRFADLHCDTLWRCFEEHRSLLHPSLQVRPEHHFSLLQNYAIYIPDSIGDSLGYFRAIYDYGRRLFDEMGRYRFCKNAREVELAIEEGARPCLISIEGGSLFSGDREKDLPLILELKDKGIAFLSLCYNAGNALAGGILCPHRGLSEKGERAAALIREFGITLDISHMNHRSADRALALLPCGIAATHSNCFSLTPHPRNLTDDQIAALSEKKGLIGLNFYPFFLRGEEAGSDDVLIHLSHMESLGAQRSIAFGGDFDGIEKTPFDLRSTEDLPALYGKLKRADKNADDYCFNNVINYLKLHFK